MDIYKRITIYAACTYLLSIAGEVEGRNSYVLMSPNVVRPGNDYTIHGELLKTPPRPVTITAELLSGGVIASASTTLTGKHAVKLDLPVPSGLSIGSKKTMSLKVRGTGGFTFTETKSLNFDPKSVSVYIQTDKAIYKPGQTVKFRVFGTTPDLKIVNDKLKVEIYDPKGNKIKQLDVSGFELGNLGGVYVGEQIMSTEPVLGDWKIKAKLLSHGDEFEEKTFEVAEYVLPKFEVELDLPPFGRYDVDKFAGKVKAKYTFGQSVKGVVDLRIKPKDERFQIKNGKRTSLTTTIELKIPINGSTDFSLPVAQIQALGGSIFVFQVNVTEDHTTLRQSDEQELTFYKKPYKLSIPKSLPDTFKPSMIYDAVVIVAQQDDSAPENINGQLNVTITEYRKKKSRWSPEPEPLPIFNRRSPRNRFGGRPDILERRSRRRSIMPPWRPGPIETSKELPLVSYPIPADGFVTFPIDIAKDLSKLRIKAQYHGVTVTKVLKKRHSPSNTYLQMRLLTKTPTVGQLARIEVKSTENPQEFTYQIYSRGTIVESGVEHMHGRKKVWTPRITAAMAPRAKIVSFFVRSDGEIIADVLVINVDGSVYDNQVDVQFRKNTAAPKDKIHLDITADTGSNVHLLGVDKSVLILASGNDITNAQVLQELREFDTKSKGPSSPFICDWRCLRWPVSVGGEDARDVFNDAGVIVITDAKVYDHIEPPIFRPMPRPMWGMRRRGGGGGGGGPMFRNVAMSARPMANPMAKAAMAFDAAPIGAPSIADFDVSVKDLAPVKRTRTLFPETWLWKKQKVHSNGRVSITETVPDTMTSWIASAFAVHPTSGLGVSNPSNQLTVSLPFFVIVNLPYSVIRGEKVMIQVTLHNLSNKKHTSHVTFSKSDAFKNIIIDANKKETYTSMDISRLLTIPANGIQTLYFPIIPERIGFIDIVFTAQSKSSSDAIKKLLLVEAEGSPREYNLPILADLKSGETITKTAEVTYPKGKVFGSEVVKAAVIGDLMGPSITGLEGLLKMPYGCGEQNMLNFAPNIFIIKYLEATNTADANTVKKSKDYMEKGYQRELTYSHPDGSFSAFGERDDSGSTWLTAFVLKSFVQAKQFIFIDDDVIHKAVDWLIKQKQPDGTVKEPGRVIHKAMQGGSVSGKTSLTAYVLISLLEARDIEGVVAKISSAKASLISYLEGQVSQMTDLYDLAIVAYALELAKSPRADHVWNKLDAKAKTGAGTKYWEKVANTENTSVKPWTKRNGVAVNIELTSYALLTLASRNDRMEGVKVLKWLTEQRNPNGGFSSTQDTVLALQALAEMAAITYSPRHDVTVTISGNSYSETLRITDLNAQVLQIRELPANIGTVTVTATGTGLTFVQIQVAYNIDDDDQNRSFDLAVTLPRETFNDFEVKACARWLETDERSSSMAVLEIGTLSGFVPDIASIFTEPAHKKVEMDRSKMILYFDEIERVRSTCATVTMQRIGMVAAAKPVPVKVYDYYEPTKQWTTLYVPQSLRNSEVCELCGEGCDVCSPK